MAKDLSPCLLLLMSKFYKLGTKIRKATKAVLFFRAFAKLPADVVDHLVQNPTALRQVLLYHVASGTWYSEGLEDGMSLGSLASGKLPVHIADGNLFCK